MYDSHKKNQIVGAILAGAKVSKVALDFGVPERTCHHFVARFTAAGTTHYIPRTGHPHILSDHGHRRLVRFVKKNRRLPLQEVAKVMSPKLSTRTVRRELQQDNIH